MGMKVEGFVMPCASKVKGSRTLEEPCFYVECLNVEAEGIMVLWYARNRFTNHVVLNPRRPEPCENLKFSVSVKSAVFLA
jgi:hypothetical protein